MNSCELIEATDTRLNGWSSPLERGEVKSDKTAEIIKAMTRIAIGERDEDNPQRPAIVGLAAPQIGAFKRIILFDTQATGEKPNFSPELKFVLNPSIVDISDEEELGREGCYSTGGVRAAVYRAKTVRVDGLDEIGKSVHHNLEGFQARIVQHEIDHLNGVRCPDRIRDPQHLHDVKLDEFQDYRENWMNWQRFYPVEGWLRIKRGEAGS